MSFHVAILILHVLGAGMVIGVVVLSLVAAFRTVWSPESLNRLMFVGKFGIWASLWQLATGIILSIQDWDELGTSPIFWTKMVLYAAEGTIAGMFIERRARQLKVGTPSPVLTRLFVVQAVLVVGIVACGVLLVEG